MDTGTIVVFDKPGKRARYGVSACLCWKYVNIVHGFVKGQWWVMTRGHQMRKIFWRRRTHSIQFNSIQFKSSFRVVRAWRVENKKRRRKEDLEERTSYRCTSNIGTTCDPLILDPVLRSSCCCCTPGDQRRGIFGKRGSAGENGLDVSNPQCVSTASWDPWKSWQCYPIPCILNPYPEYWVLNIET